MASASISRKFPCRRKVWPLQGSVQGNKIYKEMAQNYEIRKEIRRIVPISNNSYDYSNFQANSLQKIQSGKYALAAAVDKTMHSILPQCQ
jgi:hypothetical protein